MAEEKKPGLLKRIFSFGFGRKKEEEAAPEADAVDAAAEAAEAARLAEAEEKAAAEAAERKKAEEAAAAKAEAAEGGKAEARAAAEKQAKAEAARKEKGRKGRCGGGGEGWLPGQRKRRSALPEAAKAEAEKAEQAAKAKAEKEAAEKAEAEKKEAEAKKAAEEKAAAEAAAAEEADREAAMKAARLEAEEAARAAAEDGFEDDEVEPDEVEADEGDAEFDAAGDPDLEPAFDDEETVAAPTETLEIEDSKVTLTERKARKQPEPEPEEAEQEARREGWLKRLSKGLSRSSNQLKENISQVFTNRKLDDDTLQDLEDILIQADLGVETAMNITDALSAQKFGKTVSDEEVREVMAAEIEKILDPVAVDLDLDLDHQPHVILVVGVNGSGKTTTIGKLASKLYDAGFSTTLVAGDTFRAAAIEQLKIWGERTMSPVLSRPLGSDAAGLAFDAWAETHKERRDVMLMDTAGRLQNKTELMAELEKIVRVLKKQDPTAPHTVLLTLDATTGQNALNQVEIFKDVAGVNGLVMTKLDGTARGGILVAISAKHRLPVYFVGVGEQVEDLEPFEAREFARSIAGLPREDEE
ncbi:MAG: signal recognition particle-docking protein FtsY [Phyllobacteriaceae bacterium]|nr:signal recognition particle-docking protein FtsY [Phyllobacteriaceae bacterium]